MLPPQSLSNHLIPPSSALLCCYNKGVIFPPTYSWPFLLILGLARSSRASSRIWVLWFFSTYFCIISVFFIRSSTSSYKPYFISPCYRHSQLPPIPPTTNTARAVYTHSPFHLLPFSWANSPPNPNFTSSYQVLKAQALEPDYLVFKLAFSTS